MALLCPVPSACASTRVIVARPGERAVVEIVDRLARHHVDGAGRHDDQG
jgi:hypothetical protein